MPAAAEALERNRLRALLGALSCARQTRARSAASGKVLATNRIALQHPVTWLVNARSDETLRPY